MLVKDLIAKLQQMPQDALVTIPDSTMPDCSCGSCRNLPQDVVCVGITDGMKDPDTAFYLEYRYDLDYRCTYKDYLFQPIVYLSGDKS